MRQPALTLARIALGVALLLLAWRAGEVMFVAGRALGTLLSLDYGEGIVLQQALLLDTPHAYGDITSFPFIVFHYPPGYLTAVRAAMLTGLDVAFAGRLVSYLATLAAALAAGALVRAALGGLDRVSQIGGAAIAALSVFAFSPIAAWMPLARVDMLAFAFTLWGLFAALHSLGAASRTWLAAALFTAAVFTRQTTLAAPLAATLVLLLASPRDAIRLVLAGLALSLGLLGALTWWTGGGFLTHIVGYNINRYELSGFWPLYHFVVEHWPLIGAGAIGALTVAIVALRQGPRLLDSFRTDPAARATLAAFLYVGISTPLLALVAKSGSSVNYFIEWLIGCAMMVGILAGTLTEAARGPRPWAAALTGLALAVAVAAQVGRLQPPAHAGFPYGQSSEAVAEALIGLARSSDRTIISDDMLLTLRAGHQVPWEPAIFAELASLGRWDERLIVDRIHGGEFAFAVTLGERGGWLFRARYNPAVADALEAAFPLRVRTGPLVIHLPAGTVWQAP
jgi:hypothetical protein